MNIQLNVHYSERNLQQILKSVAYGVDNSFSTTEFNVFPPYRPAERRNFMSDANDSVELMIELSGSPSPQQAGLPTKRKASLATRRKLEDYFENKRLKEQIDDELSDLDY